MSRVFLSKYDVRISSRKIPSMAVCASSTTDQLMPFAALVKEWCFEGFLGGNAVSLDEPRSGNSIVTEVSLGQSSLRVEPKDGESRRLLVDPHSEAQAEVTLENSIRKMISALEDLRVQGKDPGGARCMVFFRAALESAWEVRRALSREKVLVLSAIEESVRGKKWYALNAEQILALRAIVESLRKTDFGKLAMDNDFRLLHASGLDLYPSSPTDEDDDWKFEGEPD